MAKTIDLGTHYKGDTFEAFEITVQDDANNNINLTGGTIRAQFRYEGKAGDLQKTITELSGVTVTDAVNGVIEIDSFNLTDWKPGAYYYDIEVTISGVIKTYVIGTLTVLQDVTQPA